MEPLDSPLIVKPRLSSLIHSPISVCPELPSPSSKQLILVHGWIEMASLAAPSSTPVEAHLETSLPDGTLWEDK